MFIPIILATNRNGRQSENVAKLLLETMKGKESMETQLFDVRDLSFPKMTMGRI